MADFLNTRLVFCKYSDFVLNIRIYLYHFWVELVTYGCFPSPFLRPKLLQ